MDKFVRNVALITITMLAIIFLNTYIGVHYMGHEFGGLDDSIETMAINEHDKGHLKKPHPLLELPGDAESGAFTIAALGVGIIIGFLWRKLFYEKEFKSIVSKEQTTI